MNNGNIKKDKLPGNINGRSLREKIIPTVCNLKNMLRKLEIVDGDFDQLKKWEKRSYQAYHIESIQASILNKPEDVKISKIREHILSLNPDDIGASCADIYLVAFIADNDYEGRAATIEWIFEEEITAKLNSAQAIWQVGKGDGVYLDILNQDGSIKDRDFLKKWVGLK